jgi:hypothetical protein
VLRTIAATAAAFWLGSGVCTSARQTPAAAQQEKGGSCRISGTVLKFADGTPLKGATVWLENNEDREHTIAAKTTAEGRF